MIQPGRMLRQLLKSAVNKPATTSYPAEKLAMPDKFRGRLTFYYPQCIGCKLCMRDCPSGAITIRKVGDKQFECDVDLGKCIYCAQCVDTCPKKALAMTADFELAQLDRGKLKVTYHGVPPAKTEIEGEAGPAGGTAPKA